MIVASDLYKSYTSGRGEIRALRGVSFAIPSGAVAVFAGRSGSGKTTLLHIVAGLEKADAGRVACLGVDVSALNGRRLSMFLRRQVGFVFQRGNLLSHLSVAENIALPMRLNGYDDKTIAARSATLLDRVGLPGVANAMPAELSGGELQRVSVARATAHHPALVLADEPTASVDSATGGLVTDLLVGLAKEAGSTVVIATHDKDVMQRGDLILRIEDGTIA